MNEPRGIFFHAAAAIILTLGMTNLAGAQSLPQSLPVAADTTVHNTTRASESAEPVMLADEITRRLRRMGINFSRTQLPHPYDPVGEVC